MSLTAVADRLFEVHDARISIENKRIALEKALSQLQRKKGSASGESDPQLDQEIQNTLAQLEANHKAAGQCEEDIREVSEQMRSLRGEIDQAAEELAGGPETLRQEELDDRHKAGSLSDSSGDRKKQH